MFHNKQNAAVSQLIHHQCQQQFPLPSGSFADPIRLNGLAHFTEHLLFMGTIKYPSKNYFDRLIDRGNGAR